MCQKVKTTCLDEVIVTELISPHMRKTSHMEVWEKGELLAKRKTHTTPGYGNELGWRATQKGVERALQISDVRGI